MCKEVVLPLLCTIILRKYEIPDLEEAVTVTSDSTAWFTAATLLAEVYIDLRIRSAGTGTDLPEIVLQRDDMFRQHIRL